MKKLLLLTISLILTISLACPVWADSGNEITVTDPDTYLLENDLPESEGWIQPGDMTSSTWATSTIGYVFKKTSATSCKCQISATRPDASYIKSTINIQIKNGSTYNTITNGTATKTVYTETINHIATFSISSRKTYRAKVAVKYTYNGVSTTDYYYLSLNSNGY